MHQAMPSIRSLGSRWQLGSKSHVGVSGAGMPPPYTFVVQLCPTISQFLTVESISFAGVGKDCPFLKGLCLPLHRTGQPSIVIPSPRSKCCKIFIYAVSLIASDCPDFHSQTNLLV